MSDFEGYPLIAGSINGIRSWQLEDDGTLQAVSHRYEWGPGENVAECIYHAHPKDSKHRIASNDCSCGFYAYLDPRNNDWCFGGRPRGIVKAYGTVTVGSRGFRAEKAQIVALIDSRRRVLSTLVTALAIVMLIAFMLVLPDHPKGFWQNTGEVFAGLFPAVFLAVALSLFNSGSCITRQVRRRYPGVKVYRSVRAAVRDWPLIAPEAPRVEMAAEVRERAA